MSKIGHYLQEHLTGEVISATDARRHFATDNHSIRKSIVLVVFEVGERQGFRQDRIQDDRVTFTIPEEHIQNIL